jgi:hypothetical protein
MSRWRESGPKSLDFLVKGAGGEGRGDTPLIAVIISGKFLAEQQSIPVKHMDLW